MAPAVSVISLNCADTLAADSLYTGSTVWFFAHSGFLHNYTRRTVSPYEATLCKHGNLQIHI
jgi:hypothetical protein